MFQSLIRRAWLKKGEKTVVKVEKKDQHQNYLGFLNQKTFKCHIFPIDYGRSEEIVKATTKFLKLYPGKKIVIIWDNAAHHKGHLFQKALSKGHPLEGVHLISFPPYAPDKNPIEHVWEYAKDRLANRQEVDFEITKKNFMKLINNQIFNYQM
jgi:transposase